MRTSALLVILFLSLIPVSADAGIRFSMLAGTNLASANVSTTNVQSGAIEGFTYKSEVGFAGGFLFEIPLGKHFGLEFGPIYRQRRMTTLALITRNATSNTFESFLATATYSFPTITTPLVIKLWPVKHLNIGAGGYYSRGFGKASLSLNPQTSSATASKTSGDFSNFGVKRNDYGIQGVLGLNIPFNSKAHFLIDVRYNYSLVNLAINSSEEFKFQESGVFVGIRVGEVLK